MPQSRQLPSLHLIEIPTAPYEELSHQTAAELQAPASSHGRDVDPLLTADDVARRLNVSRDWVWDHSSRKAPHLPVIRMGDGTLRYRSSGIEAFISERERLSALRRRRR
jgi:predicted DNA-binding transcriptional regulator AlpA